MERNDNQSAKKKMLGGVHQYQKKAGEGDGRILALVN